MLSDRNTDFSHSLDTIENLLFTKKCVLKNF